MNGNINFKKYNGKGYTLVELLVVIALMAIVLSIGIPSIASLFHTRERLELMEFKRDLAFARNSAIVENCKYIVSFYIVDNHYQIKKISGGTTIVKEMYLSSGLIIEKNNFDSSAVTFNSTGSPNQGGTIRLRNRKGKLIEITIEVATGKINLYFR